MSSFQTRLFNPLWSQDHTWLSIGRTHGLGFFWRVSHSPQNDIPPQEVNVLELGALAVRISHTTGGPFAQIQERNTPRFLLQNQSGEDLHVAEAAGNRSAVRRLKSIPCQPANPSCTSAKGSLPPGHASRNRRHWWSFLRNQVIASCANQGKHAANHKAIF